MNIIEQLKEKYGMSITVEEKTAKRVYINVQDKETTKEIAGFLFNDQGLRFSTASGVDLRAGIEILYHFAADRLGLVISLRVLVEKPLLEMPTITDVVPAAEWIEREIHEMLGVKFIGHPNLTTLLLPDDWPEGVYPLRKQTFESEKELTEREN